MAGNRDEGVEFLANEGFGARLRQPASEVRRVDQPLVQRQLDHPGAAVVVQPIGSIVVDEACIQGRSAIRASPGEETSGGPATN